VQVSYGDTCGAAERVGHGGCATEQRTAKGVLTLRYLSFASIKAAIACPGLSNKDFRYKLCVTRLGQTQICNISAPGVHMAANIIMIIAFYFFKFKNVY